MPTTAIGEPTPVDGRRNGGGLEVIGAGFGRTGTLSLKVALERLGYCSCHHMEAVAGSDEQIAAWHAVALGGLPDWDRIFDGYRASCDWPSCDYFEDLLRHYPEAKVVLSVRDEARWYQSALETIYAASIEFPFWLGWLVPRLARFNKMVFATVWDGTFAGRFEDREFAINVYRAHIARVKAIVPAERLLVFEAREGWAPLCRFLAVPVPAEPYPHRNDAASIKRLLRAVRITSWLVPGLAVGVLLWILL